MWLSINTTESFILEFFRNTFADGGDFGQNTWEFLKTWKNFKMPTPTFLENFKCSYATVFLNLNKIVNKKNEINRKDLSTFALWKTKKTLGIIDKHCK